jgi:hypothetical protein
MTKFGKFDDYPPRSLESAEAALLTAWRSLEQYHNDLVLVGGLAVHYLTRRDLAGLPGAVTLDVDFGITLGASGGQYGTIKTDLAGLGFTSEGNRLVRKFGDIALYLDFLTEDGPTGRRSPKDAYDVLLAVTGFIDGPEAAVSAFRAEKDAGNPAYTAALAALRADFSEANQDGPARAAEFYPGDRLAAIFAGI